MPNLQTRTHTSQCSVFERLLLPWDTLPTHSYITALDACHDWNGWDFYPAVIQSSKLSPLVLISWTGKGGYVNIFLQKKTLKLSTLPSIQSCAASQSKGTVFAFRSQCTNNQRSQRTRGVSTNPGTGVENKSYGNVAKFWGRAIMSIWNSVRGSLDRNPCGQKGTSLSLYPCARQGICLFTCKLNPQSIVLISSGLPQILRRESASLCLCHNSSKMFQLPGVSHQSHIQATDMINL